jgi:hypothetical protein
MWTVPNASEEITKSSMKPARMVHQAGAKRPFPFPFPFPFPLRTAVVGQGPPRVTGGAGGLLSLDGAAFASNLAAGQRLTLAAAGAVRIKEAIMRTSIPTLVGFIKFPWNKGRLIGQKRPLNPKEV